MNYFSSIKEGMSAEEEFIALRGDNFVRKADRKEDWYEHWDVLDKELGHIDVKAAKRKYRNGPIDYSIHWWEFKNVSGRQGWGVPNKVDRFIALRLEDRFILVDPRKVNDVLLSKCTQHFRGPYGLNTRPNRKDLAAMVPVEFFLDYVEHEVCLEV